MQGLRNVFDSKEEFEKMKGFILEGIQRFSDYRTGNLTYGEIMFVLECVLDSMRETSEKESQKNIKHAGKLITFTSLLESTSRMVERLVKKGVLNSADEAFIIHGED